MLLNIIIRSKLENELLIALDDLNTINSGTGQNNPESIFLKEFYDLLSLENKVKLDFKNNLKLIKNFVRTGEKEDLEVLFKLSNQNIFSIRLYS